MKRLLATLVLATGFAATTSLPVFAQTLPGTTIGESCTIYKTTDTYPKVIHYYQCDDGTTLKSVSYFIEDQAFDYMEWRDSDGALFATRFMHDPAVSDPDMSRITLADSRIP